jgi:hypothetical protein
MLDFYGLSQGKPHTNQEYYDEFNSMVSTAEESGATIDAHPSGIQEALSIKAVEADNPSDVVRAASIKTATERYLTIAFLLGANKLRYGTLAEGIENEYLRNKGNSSTSGTYPNTAAEAYNYLCNYKKDPKKLSRLLVQHNGGGLNTGVAFSQHDEPPADGNDGHRSATKEQAFAQHGGANSAPNRKKVCQ